jgi:hypothetical protein
MPLVVNAQILRIQSLFSYSKVTPNLQLKFSHFIWKISTAFFVSTDIFFNFIMCVAALQMELKTRLKRPEFNPPIKKQILAPGTTTISS